MSGSVLLAIFLIGVGLLTAALKTLDLGSPVREAVLVSAARRLKNRNPPQEGVQRTYWSVREYRRDAARLTALGYRVISETQTSPYLQGAALPGRSPMTVRSPVAHVTYELRK
ncbi:MAG TPA: hypothetical protein VLR46_07495 [Candidatus Dormibacteraeota bacterium]|nr:hypothetical protein [Candidatus Dormibacteraeota bacterium]